MLCAHPSSLLPQTVTAERTSYSSVDGSVISDGVERKVGDPSRR